MVPPTSRPQWIDITTVAARVSFRNPPDHPDRVRHLHPFTTYLEWALLTYVTYSIRRYWRTASVENTTTIPTIQASDWATTAAAGPPSSRARRALTVTLIGL